MHTITTKLPDELYSRLEQYGETVDRKKSYLVRKAIESFLDEREDYFVSIDRLSQKNPRVLLQDLDIE
jgi:RHH-type rel operon transcriptional repressor/antitoxin RelB